MPKKYTLGLDFGTLYARAMIVSTDGEIMGTAEHKYPHGVMEETLPNGIPLIKGFSLQHPLDYIEAIENIIPKAIEAAGVNNSDIIGVGVDFTQCTMMPILKDGTPLCLLKRFENNPYAYVKLWKHNTAQKQAQKMTEIAEQQGEEFLKYCGGRIYSETMFPKMLETLQCAPEVYTNADEFIELADWITFKLTGSKKRSASIAACASMWTAKSGYPSVDYLSKLDADFGLAAQQKLSNDLVAPSRIIGYISDQVALKTGLKAGTPVAAGIGDSQAAFVGAGIIEEGTMLMVLGTSGCDMLISEKGIPVKGMYGVTFNSIIPDMFGYEAGQAAVGDLLAWFVNNSVPKAYYDQARLHGITIFDYLNKLADKINPAQSGLVALDWWNGNRSILLDSDLTGLIIGLTLKTNCEEIYRALVESIAFGKRKIIEQLETDGVKVNRSVATGGIASKNPFMMQVLADVIGIPIEVSTVDNGSCIGSAIYAAVAAGKKAGGFDSVQSAAKAMSGKIKCTYLPRAELKESYDKLYNVYEFLYSYFGKENSLMKQLKQINTN